MHTLPPSPEPSLLAPSFDAKYTAVSENVLKGIGLRDWASKVPIIPKTGRQERPHVIPKREINPCFIQKNYDHFSCIPILTKGGISTI